MVFTTAMENAGAEKLSVEDRSHGRLPNVRNQSLVNGGRFSVGDGQP